jgi:hypothetical protein
MLAMSLIAAACSSSSAVEQQPASSSTTMAEPTTTTTSQPTRIVPVADSAPLPIGGPVEPGTYRTDLMGTEVGLTLDDTWELPIGEPGAFVLISQNQLGPTSEAVLLIRPSGLADPAEAASEMMQPTMSGPPDDVDAWLAAAGELTVTRDETTTVAGVPARVIDLVVDPAGSASVPGGCGDPTNRCFQLASTGTSWLPHLVVRTTESYRLWFVDQGNLAPILIFAVAQEGNEAWFAEADALVEGLAFGEPAPHPAPPPDGPPWEAGFSGVVPAGVVVVPALDGIGFEMSEDRFIEQDQNLIAIISTEESMAPIPPLMLIGLATERGPEPGTIMDAADFVAMVELSSTVTPLGDTIEVFGKTFQGYQVIEDPSASQQVLASAARPGEVSNFLWIPGPYSVMYVADAAGFASYDYGALVLSYDAIDETELPAAKAVFDEVIETLDRAVL